LSIGIKILEAKALEATKIDSIDNKTILLFMISSIYIVKLVNVLTSYDVPIIIPVIILPSNHSFVLITGTFDKSYPLKFPIMSAYWD